MPGSTCPEPSPCRRSYDPRQRVWEVNSLARAVLVDPSRVLESHPRGPTICFRSTTRAPFTYSISTSFGPSTVSLLFVVHLPFAHLHHTHTHTPASHIRLRTHHTMSFFQQQPAVAPAASAIPFPSSSCGNRKRKEMMDDDGMDQTGYQMPERRKVSRHTREKSLPCSSADPPPSLAHSSPSRAANSVETSQRCSILSTHKTICECSCSWASFLRTQEVRGTVQAMVSPKFWSRDACVAAVLEIDATLH